jgi:signal transduction histidine kinase
LTCLQLPCLLCAPSGQARTGTGTGDGAGLGLAIARSAAAAHGATVTARSHPADGLDITVVIPHNRRR